MHGDRRGWASPGRGQNQGMVFVKLKDWELRRRPELKAPGRREPGDGDASRRSAARWSSPSRRPRSPSSASATGFDLMLQDRGGLGHEKLSEIEGQLLGMAAQDPRLARVRPNGMADVAQYKVDIDWDKAGALGVPVSSIQSYLSGGVRQHLRRRLRPGGPRQARLGPGRRAVPDAPERPRPALLPQPAGEARAALGGRLRALGLRLAAPRALQRLPGDRNIQGEPAPGHSSGEAMLAMEELIGKLPKGVGHEWTGLSYQQRMSESQAGALYAFSILVIFLVLAALYESWTVPISIVLVLPLGVIGGIVASSIARHAERRLLPDRPPDRPRPDDEERDPDRAVRQGLRGRRDGPRRGDAARPPRRACARSS